MTEEKNPIPIQLLVTKELSPDENLWLRSLRTELRLDEIDHIINEYEKNKHSRRYQSVMDAITRGNWEKMEEEKKMCDALRELFAEEFEAVEKEKQEAIKAAEEAAEEEITRAETRFAILTQRLLEAGKNDQLLEAAKDKAYREKLYKEYEVL
ncbi:MAG: hypothetical protein PHN80_01655 [Hespellia sp.]|nr:hypothetical protein [Hespellia sp.]